MKRFETPCINVKEFGIGKIMTTSEPAAVATEAAAKALELAGVTADNTFTITL